MSSSASALQKMITLKSSDDKIFVVEEAVALQSMTLKNIIEDMNCVDNIIPVPKVTSEILAKVIEYCKRHTKKPEDLDALKAFDAEFVKVDQPMLFELILAANFLNIQSLLELMCQTMADMIKGKTTEQIRETFNIESDLDPEEEAEIRRENAWAFE